MQFTKGTKVKLWTYVSPSRQYETWGNDYRLGEIVVSDDICFWALVPGLGLLSFYKQPKLGTKNQFPNVGNSAYWVEFFEEEQEITDET